MDARTLKIFFAVFLGAFTGAMIGLQFWEQPIAWLPMTVSVLSGGLCGYLFYEIKVVFRAIRSSVRASIDPNQWHWIKWMLAFLAVAMMLPVGSIFAPNLYGPILSMEEPTGILSRFVVWAVTEGMEAGELAASLAFAGLMIFVLGIFVAMPIYHPPIGDDRVLFRFLCVLGACANPIVMPVIIPFFFAFSIIIMIGVATLVIIGIGRAFSTLGRFGIRVLKLIHSDERLLVGVDAAIGSAIGLSLHNALLGAVIGGLFGVANFELLSKRVFHFVPAKIRK